ncbi:putative Peptidoglycan domain protein [Pseudovibrio axinellae]|uniref:Putative Peptidoglycan domain protein n=1 Tax=Pseudovibrio axinellae TaxID=989403 RepID=A0A165TX29_9HYPH|nr:glycoside hydrolase family 108 protein [Pseudovibrio axinellae]KZL06754.1 putative Peptidoglycan domain protein [Pseudovibrio axinellae]SER63029.1 Lysozyme family protein [Pseudovibrio axinellae]
MKDTFHLIVLDLLGSEGGFANRSRKADPGGPTNLGITQATLEAWRGRPVSVEEVKRLGREEALKIYRAQYWDSVKGDALPRGLDYAVFDFAVNSGPARAAKTLQQILKVKVDGVIGVLTLQAVKAHSVNSLINLLCAARLKFMKRLKNWQFNKNGWSRRVRHVQERSLELANNATIKIAPKPVLDGQINEEGSKALGEQTSAISAWLSPDGITRASMAASGLSGILAGSGPLQWAFALALVVSVGVAGYLLITKERAA